jgi:hypothetical protein
MQVFSAVVYDDFDPTKVKEHDAIWEARGDTALVYDDTSVRSGNAWLSPKKASLFFVSIERVSSGWNVGGQYISPLKGTGQVRLRYSFFRMTLSQL